VEASPHRRDAPCPHYAECGGCQLQHIDYAAQLAARGGIVADALRRIARIDAPPIEVEPSPRELGYRNRVSFTLTRGGDRVTAGFHALEDAGRVVDIDACPLAEAPVNAVWSSLRENWGDGAALLPRGAELRLTLRATAAGRTGLAIEGARDAGEPAELLERVEGLDAVWVIGDHGVLGYAGEESLSERWHGAEIPLAGTAFVQVNREVAEALDRYAREQCGEVAGRRVVDAYCGFGLRALALARDGAEVTGIDLDTHAISAAKSLASGSGARFVAGRTEDAIASLLPADVVVLNPPRRGVARPALAALAGRPPERIVYIGCDPATLARDLGALAQRFELSACRAFDLFPQTANVETVATLTRKGDGATGGAR
jgi:23S rRNA (uracil1939-C5)-methyltransferase